MGHVFRLQVKQRCQSFAAAGMTVLQTSYGNFSRKYRRTVGAIYILHKDKARAATLEDETAPEPVIGPERLFEMGIDTRQHGVDTGAVHLGEGHATRAAELVPRVLQIMQIVGVVHYALIVQLVVAHLYLHCKLIPIRDMFYVLIHFPVLLSHSKVTKLWHNSKILHSIIKNARNRATKAEFRAGKNI